MNYRDLFLKKNQRLRSRAEKLNHAREYTQALYLAKLQEVGWFKHCAFMGGTCLRLCYNGDRFSEDLDFVLIKPGRISVDTAERLLHRANKLTLDCGFKLRMRRLKNIRNIWNTFVVFEEVLGPSGISEHPKETLQIKIEVDSNPPDSFECDVGTAANRDQDIIVTNIIKGTDSTLFGGKMHAVLYRVYTKGRDIYDLHWYLQKGIPLNIRIVEDTQKSLGKDDHFTRASLLKTLIDHLTQTDMKKAMADVCQFVNDQDILPMIFDRDRLFNLAKGIRFYRAVLPQEYFQQLTTLLGWKGGKPDTLEKAITEKFFELKEGLDEKGVFPSNELQNSKTEISMFLGRHRKLIPK